MNDFMNWNEMELVVRKPFGWVEVEMGIIFSKIYGATQTQKNVIRVDRILLFSTFFSRVWVWFDSVCVPKTRSHD